MQNVFASLSERDTKNSFSNNVWCLAILEWQKQRVSPQQPIYKRQ